MKKLLPPFRQYGFSLVEVVLAIGVASFSLLAVVGTVPVGLGTAQESMMRGAQANIMRELRGEFEQISFGNTDSTGVPTAIASLTGTTYYYSQEGIPMTGSAGAYYAAKFSVGAGGLYNSSSTYEFQPNNADNITVTLSYPVFVPDANRKAIVFTLFVAKQKSN